MKRLILLLLSTAGALTSSLRASSIEEWELSLPIASSTPSLYLGKAHADHPDWRYYEDLRSILEFDLTLNSFCKVLSPDPKFEEWAAEAPSASVKKWKEEQVSFVLSLEIVKKELHLTALDIEKGSMKRYPPLSLSNDLDQDRLTLHQFADHLQKDLFGYEGISSLSLLYSQKKPSFTGSSGWEAEIWRCDVDGARARQITTENGYCLSPLIFPRDPHQFCFVSYKHGQPKIYSAYFKSPKAKPLISLRGNQALPAISPDGKQIAFINDAAGRPDLFIQNLDGKAKTLGKARQLFSMPRATQASPTYSPDGKQIAFVSDKDGPARIYVMDIPGPKSTQKSHPRLLTRKNRENTSPSWSPDGKKLAFSAKVEGTRQIWIYDFATQEEKPLTQGPGNKENPQWAPDSVHLVYNTESEESCELFIVSLQNPIPFQISKGPGQKRFPSWIF